MEAKGPETGSPRRVRTAVALLALLSAPSLLVRPEPPTTGARAASPAAGNSGPPPPPARPSGPKTASFVLENGLLVHLRRIEDTERAGIVLQFALGSGDDPENKPEMVHFLEHLFIEGRPRRPAAVASGRPGMPRWGGWTSRDWMWVYKTVDCEVLPAALDDLAGRLEDLDVTEEVFRREMDDVVEQIHGKTDLRDLSWRAAGGYSVLPEQVDAQHRAREKRFRSIGIEEVRALAALWLRPWNARLSIAGGIDVPEMRTLVERTLGRIPIPLDAHLRVERIPRRPDAPVPGMRVAVARPGSRERGTLEVALPVPLPGSPLYAAYLVLAARLSSSRNLPALDPPDFDLLTPGRWMFLEEGLRDGEAPEKALARLWEKVDAVVSRPVGPDDVVETRGFLADAFSTDDSRHRGSRDFHYRAAFAHVRTAQLRIDVPGISKALPWITDGELASAARKYLSPESGSALAHFRPSRLERFTLPNGLRVVLRRTDHSPGVAMALVVGAGRETDGRFQPGLARVCAEVRAPRDPATNWFHGGRGEVGRDFTLFGHVVPSRRSPEVMRRFASLLGAPEPGEKEVAAAVAAAREAEAGGGRVTGRRVLAEAWRTLHARRDGAGTPGGTRVPAVEDVRAAVRRWYRPDNSILVMYGSFDPVFERQVIELIFSGRHAPGTIPTPSTARGADEEAKDADPATAGAGPAPLSVAAWPAPRPAATLEYASWLVLCLRNGTLHRTAADRRKSVLGPLYLPEEEPGVLAYAEVMDPSAPESKAPVAFIAKSVRGSYAPVESQIAWHVVADRLDGGGYSPLFDSRGDLFDAARGLALRERMGFDAEALGRIMPSVTEESVRQAAERWLTAPPVVLEIPGK
jgi:predicted Zn-dependent peptidase